jgi:hypothetical protein
VFELLFLQPAQGIASPIIFPSKKHAASPPAHLDGEVFRGIKGAALRSVVNAQNTSVAGTIQEKSMIEQLKYVWRMVKSKQSYGGGVRNLSHIYAF